MSIIREFATSIITGKNFSPKELFKSTGFKFYNSHEKDDLIMNSIKKEKWKHGGSIINKASHINKKGDDIKLSDLLDFLQKNKKHLDASGAEKIQVRLILAYDSDMSAWHIEYEDLKKLADLGIGLSLDIYESSEEEGEEDHDQE